METTASFFCVFINSCPAMASSLIPQARELAMQQSLKAIDDASSVLPLDSTFFGFPCCSKHVRPYLETYLMTTRVIDCIISPSQLFRPRGQFQIGMHKT